mgnify:CR=1 FL=1
MSDMEYRKLKTLAKYPTGKLNSNAAVEGGEYPFFTCAHDIYRIDQYSYDGEYVLLGGNNASGDFPIFYYNGKFDAYQRTYLIQPLSEDTDTKYLYYSIGLKLHQMKANASGTATKFLTQPILNNINIEYRDIDEQKRIADILSAYDNLIENNNKRIRILEQMAENLYKEWFVRFRFPGYEDVEFEDGMPKGWVREKIGLHYNTCSGGTPSRTHEEYYADGTIPWVKTGEIKDNIIIHTDECITEDGIKGSSAKLLPQGAVVMAMYGVNIGMLAYLDSEMTCNQACCVFSDKNEIISRHYLFHYLYSIRDYLLLIGFGAAQQNLSQDLIKKVKIVIPPTELIKKFDEQKEPLYQTIRALMMQNDKLIKQRDMLLPRLMSGKLEV